MCDTRDTRDLLCWYSGTCTPAVPTPRPTPRRHPKSRKYEVTSTFIIPWKGH